MKILIISNNPLILRTWDGKIPVRYIDGSAPEVLLAVRDLCHLGYRLLTHPLSGSIKPNETPYKSVLLAGTCCGTDTESILLTENAIDVVQRFGPIRRNWQERELKDFQLVDASLLAGAAESAIADLKEI